MTTNITYYKGTPLEELPRETLIEAVKHALDLYSKEREGHLATIEINSLARGAAEEQRVAA